MVDTGRARKLADRIKVVVAQTLEHRIKDPRLGFITITDARVTGDLQHATVFYTVLGSDEERAATAAALDSARGLLRSEVGKATGLRLTPSLEFVADAVPDNARAIDDLLRRAAAQDEEVAALAVGKQYAGEADPYKRPEDDDLDDDELADDELADAGEDPGDHDHPGEAGRRGSPAGG